MPQIRWSEFTALFFRRRVREIHEGSRGVINAPRMLEDLLDEGEVVSLNRIARLMATEEIQGWPRSKKRGVGRVATGHSAGVKTLLERDYADLELERKWGTDSTEITTLGDSMRSIKPTFQTSR